MSLDDDENSNYDDNNDDDNNDDNNVFCTNIQLQKWLYKKGLPFHKSKCNYFTDSIF